MAPTMKKKTVKSAPKPKMPRTSLDLPIATGSQADYEEFAPLASRVSANEVIPMRADLQLALHNVQLGVKAVLEHKARLARLPETRMGELESLPRLVLATIYADTQIDRSLPPGKLQELLARCTRLRTLLVRSAESLVEAGMLPRARVEAVRSGSGKLDSARDCVALAALFTNHAAALRGKHPVSAAQVKEASEVGTELLKMLKTGRSRPLPPTGTPAADMRDRLWTLVVRRADALSRAAVYLFGREADQKVPALQSSRGGRSRRAQPIEPSGPAPLEPVV
jgi:hypothetical protein